MKKKWILMVGMMLATMAFIVGCGSEKKEAPAVQAPAPVELNISAAVSLKDALLEIQTNYQAKHPNVKLLYNLGASGSLQKQIEQGAPADLFISAAPKQMDDLAAKNLLSQGTRKNLVENKLVLIVPENSSLSLTKYEDLTNDKVQKIGIGEPSVVPAGDYAQQVFKKLGLWDQLSSKLVLAKDVRTVLAYVETGNVEAGIVYKTDAASSKKVKIAATAPEGSHKPILYPVAILANTKQSQAAADFLAYLSTPESAAVFEKYGFTMSK
ncbi:MAG: molybdate ABC transporter substrate-binding protein [Sporomusaceae bacterium]|nr:molybdate ABC transporter substrate-binding protein [Sporomusaceae bacterium]